ncbi:MAG: hypothetical protein BWK77_02400 [Verrucomicrobia bacterium A1]|nr:MAG: hypothetical protein BWK77_02400 [Verrucomicrobia bacterium A1]
MNASSLPWVDIADPSDDAIRDVFAALPRRGGLRIRCIWERRGGLLAALSDCGAFAMRADPAPGFDTVTITALKGKAGACYETGRSATYLGAAAAVMDDDRHLVAGTLRVCEKTGGLYRLPPYAGLLRVTDADPDLLRRLDTDPVPFDCNTFEADAARIAASLKSANAGSDTTTAVYYPGPFSLLVLSDGSIIRRAIPVGIPAGIVPALRKRDGLLLPPPACAAEAEPAANFRDGYAAAGAGCLIENLGRAMPVCAPAGEAAVPESAWDALRDAPPALRDRIGRLVAGREPYFILTGSDPRNSAGCCPSTDVGAANRLVEAGLLATHRMPAPADACTTTVYAFAGEIDGAGPAPAFRIRTDLRARAAAELGRPFAKETDVCD